MLRVSAVGNVICDHFKDTSLINKERVTQTLLLHDMANIVKFTLNKDDIFYKGDTEELDELRQVQKEFQTKYGMDEHIATSAILKELGVSKDVFHLFEQVGSPNLERNIKENNIEAKISTYSDLRVGPHGVVTVDKRWDDVNERYRGRKHRLGDLQKSEEKRKLTHLLEKQLQELVHFNLPNIDNKMTAKYFQELRKYNLHLNQH